MSAETSGGGLSRRGLLAAVVAAAVPVAVPGVARADVLPDRGPVSRARAFLNAAMDACPTSGPVRLAQSYGDQAGLFSTAFSYDNALALLAHLALGDRGGRGARSRAVLLGDALRYAQEHDPGYDDGRIRQAYNTGPYTFYDGTAQPDGFIRADGTANVATQFGFTGTAVGDMAWVGLALTTLADRTGARRFLASAVRIGEWIERNARAEGRLGGYSFGVDGANAPVRSGSTEHNIDLVALFGRLARLTGDTAWTRRRERAEAFVLGMWNPDGGFFHTGTNDGETVNRYPVPEDTQTWSALALPFGPHRRSVDWAAANLRVVDHAGRVNSAVPVGQSYEGVTFSTAGPLADESAPIGPGQPKPNRHGVWFEGTAHLALALRVRGGGEGVARRLLASVESAQELLGGGQTIGGRALPARAGVVSASSPIDTGFGFGYYPYRHVGATSWYLLAATRSNPFA